MAINRGSGASGREIGTLFRVSHVAKTRDPGPAAVLDGQGGDDLVFESLVAEQVKAITHDGRGRITAAGVAEFPERLRAGCRPFLEQTGLARNPVSLRATPLRPILGLNR